MIRTFYGIDQSVTAPSGKTFLAAIFYFRDMTVLKVMFTVLITAMLGLSLVVALGWVDLQSQIYLLPTRPRPATAWPAWDTRTSSCSPTGCRASWIAV